MVLRTELEEKPEMLKKAVVRYGRDLTLESCICAIPVREVEKIAQARKPVVMTVAEIVKIGISFFKVRHSMTEVEVSIFASEWTALYQNDSLEDLVLMFRLARQGELGQIYNRVDYSVLMELWRAFLDRKWQLIEASKGSAQQQLQLNADNKAEKVLGKKASLKRLSEIKETLRGIGGGKKKTTQPKDQFSNWEAWKKMVKKEAKNWTRYQIQETINSIKAKSLSLAEDDIIEYLEGLLIKNRKQ